MKTTLVLCALAANGLAALPIQNRITAETLVSHQANNPMCRLVKPEAAAAKVARPDNQSILRDSTVLHDGSNWTIVPVGAVVFTPEKLKGRVNAAPTGKMLSWNDFLTANYAWISTCEVDFDQASGKTALPEERTSFWSKQNKLVVAVHQRGPISARLKTATTPPTP
ncbi:MAG: hypothetical protein MUF86_12085 [Akkermansiaceae bacterium]|jgi:hypothetical protein|nr:hypothetical protein [Akkermansiaceae bacterium]